MCRDLLSHFECSVVFQVNSNPGSTERMTADRSKNTGINCSPPNHSVSLRARHGVSGRLFLAEGLKQRLARFKARFFQILGHVILGLVMDRHLVMFAAFFKEPEPAPVGSPLGSPLGSAVGSTGGSPVKFL